ncbi:MAG: hypothetical protein Q9220_003300 [cf. Caloplaca sp. 1 TL-2023]
MTTRRSLNNTILFDASSPCQWSQSSLTPIQCSGKHGGFFDEGSSTTWNKAANLTASGASIESEGQLEDYLWGIDSVRCNSNISIKDYSVGIMRSAPPDLHTVGLGANSTFLNALFSAGTIASKSWGLLWGWQGASSDEQTEGSLVLGGYDSAKTTGPNVTYPFAKHPLCQLGLVVTITDIVLNLKNGSSSTILPPSAGSAMRACIGPDFPLIQLPYDTFTNFLTVSDYRGSYPGRSTGMNFWGMNFPSQNVYDGDITFTFSSEIDIRIPNHQLVMPDYSVNAQGFVTEANSSVRELFINSLADVNKNDMPLLGRAFLSSAYLHVDNERKQFTLWSANPTATQQNLIRVGPANCTSDASPSTQPNPASKSTPASINDESDNSISKGGIAGVAIGIFATIIIAGLLLVRWRHRRRPRTPIETRPGSDESDRDMSFYLNLKPEMPSDRQPPQELPLEENQSYAVAPHEMPSDRQPPQEMSLEQNPSYSSALYEMSAGPGTRLLDQNRGSQR